MRRPSQPAYCEVLRSPATHHRSRRPVGLPRRRTSICGPARCSPWSASRVPARRPCSARCPSALRLTAGSVALPRGADGRRSDLVEISEQPCAGCGAPNGASSTRIPADGLRMHVSAGGNVGEPLMATGWRHYGRIRAAAAEWLRAGGDPRGPHRRRPASPSPAACGSACRSPATWCLAAPGVHGRAHQRARRVGAGAPARPDPLARQPSSAWP